MKKRSGWFLPKALCALLLIAPAGVLAETLGERLQSLADQSTRVCALNLGRVGMGSVLAVQFEKQPTQAEDRRKIEGLLELFEEHVLATGQTFISFHPLRRWKKCQSGSLREVFWYGPDREWISVGKNPGSALRRLANRPNPNWKDAPQEAYLRYALARIEFNKDRVKAGVEELRRAADILIAKGDPLNLQPAILPALVRYYLGSGHDPELGQRYLNASALLDRSNRATSEEFIPLVRSAAIYPREAYREGIEGYAVLEFRVTEEGRVENAVVIEESPKGVFGRAALTAVNGFIYAPKVVNGERVASEGVRTRISFQIER